MLFGLSRVLLNNFLKIILKKVKKKLARQMKISIIVFVDDEFEASSKREKPDLMKFSKAFLKRKV